MSVPFEQDADVTLQLPQARVPARVVEAGDGWVTLALFVRPLASAEALEGAGAAIEATGRRGVERAEGRVAVEGELADALVKVEVDGAAQIVQRRDFVRVDAVLPTRLWRVDEPPMDTFALNVSGGGFLVGGPHTLKIGERLRFELRLPDGAPGLSGTARVVREGPNGSRGCQIEEIAEQARELIVRFTFRRQRVEIQSGVAE